MVRAESVVEARELVRTLAAREIRGLYKGSALGWVWSLLNPLALVLTFTLVFRVVFRAPPPLGDPSGLNNYTLYLISGLIPWNLFSVALSGCTGSLVAQSSLITKVYFPRATVVVAKAIAVAFSSLIEFAVVIAVLQLAGNMVLPWLPIIVVLFVLELLFALGLGLLLSVANVYFRDVQYLLSIGLQLLFYAAPIIYPLSLVPQRARTLYGLNPLVRLVEAYRDVLYHLRWPPFGDIAYLALWAIGMLVIGSFVFGRLEGRLAEEL